MTATDSQAQSHNTRAKPQETAAEISQNERASGLRTTKRVMPYLWPDGRTDLKVRVVLAMVALLATKVVSIVTPMLYKQAVDALGGEATALALGAIGLTVAYGGARLMNVGFQQLRDAIFAIVAVRALRQLAIETFEHMHQLSMRYHISRKTGGLSRVIERGVKGVDFLLRYLLFSVGPLFLEVVLVAVTLAYLFDFRYLVVVIATVAVYIWFTISITEWRVRLRREMNEQDTDANQKAIDSLLNFETVKYFGAERREAERYDSAMEGYAKASLKTQYSLAALNFGQAFLIALGLVIVMVMAAQGVAKGDLTVGDFVMVNAYMIQLTMPLNFLGFVYREIRQALTDMGAMFDLLDQPAEVADKPGAPDLKITGGEVHLRDVHFGYDAARPILKGIDLCVEPGSQVAIVGSSGSGKSTVGRLLFRFYDVQSGALTIDGQDVRDVTQSSLHDAVGVVPQDTVLFNDTVRYNIGYGKANAREDEIIQAAKDAQIHDFIMGLPDGYDTTVGERGLKLSGGEKQRVGIARTLLKNPPILLLDEATSALDTETEHEIKEALARAAEGRTVLTIAHRLSTIAEADRIVVLEAGEIVEQGSHAELLAKDGRYAALWAMQLTEEVD